MDQASTSRGPDPPDDLSPQRHHKINRLIRKIWMNVNPTSAGSAELYFQHVTKYLKEADSQLKSPALQFNKKQCEYLVKKLESAATVVDANFQSHSEWLEILKLLVRLANDVKCFVDKCCKKKWIQGAIMSANVCKHVALLDYELELCTFLLRNPGISELTLEETFINIKRTENMILVEDYARLDRLSLQKKVKDALNAGSIWNGKDLELAHNLLGRLEALLCPPPDTPSASSQMRHWRVDYTSLKRGQFVGKGVSASVFKSKWLGVQVAEKAFQVSGDCSYVEKELHLLVGLSHPNVLQLLCYAKEDNGKFSIVTEFMDGGDLQRLIKGRLKNRKIPFSVDEYVDIMLQIGEGMDYLHGSGVLHRDLKAANILVKNASKQWGKAHWIFKMADFGESKMKESSVTYANQTKVGSSRWMAPEVLDVQRYIKTYPWMVDGRNVEKYPSKSDVYSFSMVCYELLTGDVPFSVDSPEVMMEKVFKGDRPALPNHCPVRMRSLIMKCWDPDAMARPSFTEICKELRFLKCSLLISREYGVQMQGMIDCAEKYDTFERYFETMYAASSKLDFNRLWRASAVQPAPM